MEQNIFNNSQGLTLFPILSLLIFFIFFFVLLIWVVRMNKKLLKEMAEIPFDNINENIEGFSPKSRKLGIIEGEEL